MTRQCVALRQPEKKEGCPLFFKRTLPAILLFFMGNLTRVVDLCTFFSYWIWVLLMCSINLCVFADKMVHIEIEFLILSHVNLITNLNPSINLSNQKTTKKSYYMDIIWRYSYYDLPINEATKQEIIPEVNVNHFLSLHNHHHDWTQRDQKHTWSLKSMKMYS